MATSSAPLLAPSAASASPSVSGVGASAGSGSTAASASALAWVTGALPTRAAIAAATGCATSSPSAVASSRAPRCASVSRRSACSVGNRAYRPLIAVPLRKKMAVTATRDERCVKRNDVHTEPPAVYRYTFVPVY